MRRVICGVWLDWFLTGFWQSDVLTCCSHLIQSTTGGVPAQSRCARTKRGMQGTIGSFAAQAQQARERGQPAQAQAGVSANQERGARAP